MRGKTIKRLKKIAKSEHYKLIERTKRPIRFQEYWRKFKTFFHDIPRSDRNSYMSEMLDQIGEKA